VTWQGAWHLVLGTLANVEYLSSLYQCCQRSDPISLFRRLDVRFGNLSCNDPIRSGPERPSIRIVCNTGLYLLSLIKLSASIIQHPPSSLRSPSSIVLTTARRAFPSWFPLQLVPCIRGVILCHPCASSLTPLACDTLSRTFGSNSCSCHGRQCGRLRSWGRRSASNNRSIERQVQA
jgi:hypothetical protein